MKQVVKLFQPRFATLVKAGAKTQTIRKVPKRERDMPKVGDELCASEWTGAPYRSKQRVLMHGIITKVARVDITETSIAVDSYAEPEEAFAKADGFKDEFEMRDWFRETHGLPFEGILICWNPL